MIHFAGVCVNVRKWYHAISFFAGEFVSLSVQGTGRDGAATNMLCTTDAHFRIWGSSSSNHIWSTFVKIQSIRH